MFEKAAALVEKINQLRFQSYLVNRFQLNESRALQISKLLGTWKKIEKKRTITSADLKVYSRKLLGFDLSVGMKAYKKALEGDRKDLDGLIEQAAEVNLTDPEHMREILRELMP